MPKEIEQENYINNLVSHVKKKKQKRDLIKEAYKNALDTRKFEIELYWKRATYFWAFIGVFFVSTFTMLNSYNFFRIKNNEFCVEYVILFLLMLLGYLFSLAWYFVNRGSKVWQKNWEKHIDLLENEINGPLFKTVIKPNFGFWNLNSYFPYSVSKVNQNLSIAITIFWIVLINLSIYQVTIQLNNISCKILYYILINFIIFITGYIFHHYSLSFMYRDWKSNRKSIRTYINID